ncbi:MAG: chemotaxis protein CheX [Treponema sp.]|nr:chemotaxis protein CheX [Treponema sp.]
MEKYIKPFVDVCIKVFKDFIGCDLTAGNPYFENKDIPQDWDISAIIGLTGEARGAVVISMRQELAAKLTGLLTGSEHRELDGEVVDAVGEIVNIIAGNVKRELEESFRLIISLPSIVEGSNHIIKWPASLARIMCIPFTVFEDHFCLSVAIESVKKA